MLYSSHLASTFNSLLIKKGSSKGLPWKMSIRRFFSQSSIRSRGLKHLSSAHKEREDVTRKKKVFVINTGGMMAVNNEGKKWKYS